MAHAKENTRLLQHASDTDLHSADVLVTIENWDKLCVIQSALTLYGEIYEHTHPTQTNIRKMAW